MKIILLITGIWLLLGFLAMLWCIKLDEVTTEELLNMNPFMCWGITCLGLIAFIIAIITYIEQKGWEVFRFARYPWMWFAQWINPLTKEKYEE